MKNYQKFFLPAVLAVCAGIGFMFTAEGKRFTFGDVYAPVEINVEIAKQYAGKVSVLMGPEFFNYSMAPTGPEGGMPNTVIHAELPAVGVQGIYLTFDRALEREILDSIACIAVFSDNKLFCYDAAAAKNFLPRTGGGG